jgi:hypothetical protein
MAGHKGNSRYILEVSVDEGVERGHQGASDSFELKGPHID